MDLLKNLKEQVNSQQSETEKEESQTQAQVQQNDEKSNLSNKSKLTNQNKKEVQINYFQSPAFNNTILNSLASIKPMTLQDNSKAFVIGICGGVSAGKSIITNLIYNSLKTHNLSVANLIQSSFYKQIPQNDQNQNKDEQKKNYNYDEPDAIDWVHFKEALTTLIDKKPFNAPVYDMKLEQYSKETQNYRTADVIIVEGTLIFSQEPIRELFNLKLFLDTDEDVRLSRRIYKDVCIRGKDIENVVQRYLKYTKIGFEKYTLPSKKYADIIIPNYGGGYSSSYQEEILAGFGSLDNAALEVIINQIVTRGVEQKVKQGQQN
ncbi:uridine kinase (macronuclear) [Tetrahymena thermophila SB210]|uniref:uridine/cytidine kinase n=1 Tax=Tetrahymena thermophila (strain SB210) TaxID=312017 RepID=I7MCM4_TETTS|nr:uridine kinase [Tetrahymena thermophila SB210]EAR84296.2 uridine kinase [Tetrahymena thermophila SB210]|eukprot:XP_001031959.2 uridine kinase [Tetrahymena thermophila SB210]